MIAHRIELARILGLTLVLLATRDALGDDTMNIRVYNDTSDEIVKAALLTLDGAVVNPALAPAATAEALSSS